MNKSKILLIILLLQGFFVNAQFNDSIHHYIRYAATGIINKTDDSKSYLVSNALHYNLRNNHKSVNFNGSYVYGQQNKILSNNDFSSTLDFNLLPNDSAKFYYWGLLNYDKSYSLKINGRLQAGLGVAYNFVDNSKRFINISEGILYEKSSLKLTDTIKSINEILRNSLRLRYRFAFSDIVVLDGTNFLQNSLSNRQDYIIKLSNTLSFKLRKWLSLTTAITYNRINITNRENLLITFGLAAETYF